MTALAPLAAAAAVLSVALAARRGWGLPVRRRLPPPGGPGTLRRAAASPARGRGLRDGFGRGPLPGRGPAPSWLVRLFDQADVPADPERAWLAWRLATGGAAALGWLGGGPALAVVAAGASAAAPAVALHLARGRGDARYQAAVPAALDAVARALRSGASLRQALAEAGEATPGRVGADVREVARAAAHGVPLADALDRWAEARPSPAVRMTVAALGLAVETGGARAAAVDGVAATIRDRLAVAAEARALSSQARVSAAVISLSPLAFAAFAAGADPRTATFLFRTGPGVACLALGLTLDALSVLWMGRLTRPRP